MSCIAVICCLVSFSWVIIESNCWYFWFSSFDWSELDFWLWVSWDYSNWFSSLLFYLNICLYFYILESKIFIRVTGPRIFIANCMIILKMMWVFILFIEIDKAQINLFQKFLIFISNIGFQFYEFNFLFVNLWIFA